MPLIGLIGNPLSHSFSPEYFRKKFEKLNLKDWRYELFQLESLRDLPKLIEEQPELVAFNVTIPYKSAIIPFCEEISEEVEELGASNLILINRNRKTIDTDLSETTFKNNTYEISLSAFNTDIIGFKESLKSKINLSIGKALVMGTGGSSKAVGYVLAELNIPYIQVGRDSKIKYHELDLYEFGLIVNCTPVGMKRNGIAYENELLPLQYETAKKDAYFFDLVYNPETTAQMREFSKQGVKSFNGLEMLHLQADAAWKIISGNFNVLP